MSETSQAPVNLVEAHYKDGAQVYDKDEYMPWGYVISDIERQYSDLSARLETLPDAPDPATFAQEWQDDRALVLGPTREYLGSLDPWRRQVLNQYLDASDAPQLLRPAPASGGDWARHLALAPDEVLIDFWQWQTQDTQRANADPEFRQWVAYADREYEQRVRDAVAPYGLPQSAIEALGRVAEARVMAGDVFDLALRGILGCCYKSIATIVLDPTYDTGVYVHEKGHLLGELPHRARNEAVVEHTKLGIIHGDFLTIDPDVRRDDPGLYRHKRKLWATELSRGRRDVTAVVGIAAYIEADENGPAYQRYVGQVNDSYNGVDVHGYTTRQREATYAELVQQFPEATSGEIDSGQDRFATYALEALADTIHGASVWWKLLQMEEDAQTARQYAEELGEDPTIDPYHLRNVQMNAYILTRHIERLRNGEIC